MELQVFITGLLFVSTLTGLVTEAVKKYLDERGTAYRPNALAGWVALVVSLLIGIAYIVITGAAVTATMIVYLVALMLLSWLCAMVGYDKVVQTLAQMREVKQDVDCERL